MGKVTGSFIRDAAIAVIVSVGGAVILKYSDIPTRVSVVESRVSGIDQTLQNVDNKLDILIQRTR